MKRLRNRKIFLLVLSVAGLTSCLVRGAAVAAVTGEEARSIIPEKYVKLLSQASYSHWGPGFAVNIPESESIDADGNPITIQQLFDKYNIKPAPYGFPDRLDLSQSVDTLRGLPLPFEKKEFDCDISELPAILEAARAILKSFVSLDNAVTW